MTIDKVIEIMEEVKRYDFSVYSLNPMYMKALDTSIEVMRKYEKIERILNWREYDVDPNYHTNEDMIDEIKKVIEDGNDDTM